MTRVCPTVFQTTNRPKGGPGPFQHRLPSKQFLECAGEITLSDTQYDRACELVADANINVVVQRQAASTRDVSVYVARASGNTKKKMESRAGSPQRRNAEERGEALILRSFRRKHHDEGEDRRAMCDRGDPEYQEAAARAYPLAARLGRAGRDSREVENDLAWQLASLYEQCGGRATYYYSAYSSDQFKGPFGPFYFAVLKRYRRLVLKPRQVAEVLTRRRAKLRSNRSRNRRRR